VVFSRFRLFVRWIWLIIPTLQDRPRPLEGRMLNGFISCCLRIGLHSNRDFILSVIVTAAMLEVYCVTSQTCIYFQTVVCGITHQCYTSLSARSANNLGVIIFRFHIFNSLFVYVIPPTWRRCFMFSWVAPVPVVDSRGEVGGGGHPSLLSPYWTRNLFK